MTKESEPQSILIRKRPIDHLLGTTEPIPRDVIEKMVRSGRNILDYGRYMGHPETDLRDQLEAVPETRREIIEDIVIPSMSNNTIPTLYEPLSRKRINPETVWEGDENGNKPDLFFGMGGGSTSIVRATTFEALTMFLTAEALRRTLGLGKARAVLANRITFTNLPYSSDFLPEGVTLAQVQQVLKNEGPEGIERYAEIQRKINTRLGAERDIYTLLIEKMGFDMKSWDIFLQTDMAHVVDKEALERYELTTRVHNQILGNLSGLDEYHYAQEDGIIDALVNGPLGGIKVGWFIRNLDEVHGGYIMDEQPFHARWIVGQALREDTDGQNKVTLAYAYAAPRLYPDPYGNLRKASPYICYDPEDMITLHPDEDIVGKFQRATQAGGGLHFSYIRNYYSAIVAVFEELTGVQLKEVDVDGYKVPLIPYASTDKKTWGMVPLRVKAMRDWLIKGNEKQIAQLWQAFDEDSPKVSVGLPMKLPTSKYFEALGIQPKDLYYRIKDQSYGTETFLELSKLYQGDSERIDLTRDILILASLVHDKVAAIGGASEKIKPDGALTSLKIARMYSALGKIGLNAGIVPLNPSSEFHEDGVYAPDMLMGDETNSGLHINPTVAEWIASLERDNVHQIRERLDSFLTVMSYPHTNVVREKAKELGYDLKGMTDKDLKALQALAEEFYESRLKGSTPRKKWMEIYRLQSASGIPHTAEGALTTTVDQYPLGSEQDGIHAQLTKSIETLQRIRDGIENQSHVDSAINLSAGASAAEGILLQNIPALAQILGGAFRYADYRGTHSTTETIRSLPAEVAQDIQRKIDELFSTVIALSFEAVDRLKPYLPVTIQTSQQGYKALRYMAKEYMGTPTEETDVPSTFDMAAKTLGELDEMVTKAVNENRQFLNALYEDAVEQAKIQLTDEKKRSMIHAALVEEQLKALRHEAVVGNDGLIYSRYQMLVNEIIASEGLEDSDETLQKNQEAYEKAKDAAIITLARERAIRNILDSLEHDQLLCQALASRQRVTPEDFLIIDEATKRKVINHALDSRRHVVLSTNPPRVFYGRKYLEDTEKQIRDGLEDPSGLSDDELAMIARIRKKPEKRTVFTLAEEYLRRQIAASLEDSEALLDASAKNLLNTMVPQMSRNAVDAAIKSLGITIDEIVHDPTVLDRSTKPIVELAIENFRVHS